MLELFIAVWIWSSICEEVFVRGLIQTLLIKVLKKDQFYKFNYSIWISGIFFGLMHFAMLIYFGIFGLFIIMSAVIIGILAAYYREKSDSIYPAIMVHIIANVIGSLDVIIKNLL